MGALKKTSIYLDDELDLALARRAAEEDLTKAELIRRTLAAAVLRPRRVKPTLGVFRGPGDLAVNHDCYLGDPVEPQATSRRGDGGA